MQMQMQSETNKYQQRIVKSHRFANIEFYRLLLREGVEARCRQVMGTIHGTEIFPVTCPEISRDTAAHLADFCRAPDR